MYNKPITTPTTTATDMTDRLLTVVQGIDVFNLFGMGWVGLPICLLSFWFTFKLGQKSKQIKFKWRKFKKTIWRLLVG